METSVSLYTGFFAVILRSSYKISFRCSKVTEWNKIYVQIVKSQSAIILVQFDGIYSKRSTYKYDLGIRFAPKVHTSSTGIIN